MLNQGHDPEQAREWTEELMPEIAQFGKQQYLHEKSVQDMRAAFRQRFGRT